MTALRNFESHQNTAAISGSSQAACAHQIESVASGFAWNPSVDDVTQLIFAGETWKCACC